MATILATIIVFVNLFSYTDGAHNLIKGHHTFFIGKLEFVGAIFGYMTWSGAAPNMQVLISGRSILAQNNITRRRVLVELKYHKALLIFS